jgi:cytochrome c peroxidase
MKTRLSIFISIGILTSSIFISSCNKDDESLSNTNNKDQLTTEEIVQLDLGRVLFYDQQLSANNAVSCGSCHKQHLAFADNVAKSKGFNNQLTDRNSMPIQNLFTFFDKTGFFEPNGEVALFWDGRETDLEKMVLRPVANHVEMGFRDMDKLVAKLEKIPYYPMMFEHRYGDPEITTERIGMAMASFISDMQSFGSRFDNGELNANELYGKFLFENKYPCNDCHNVQIPNGYLQGGEGGSPFTNIGLDVNSSDKGLGAITGLSQDNGKFKVPSLHNIAITGPYMHDGRFETLSEVIQHYSTGMKNHPGLDDRLKGNDGAPLKLNISEEEEKALIAFLNSMTDIRFITNPSLSDPFK